LSANLPRSCPVCQRALRRDWLNACAACGVETLDEVPAQVWRPRSPHEVPSRALGVTVTHAPPPRDESLYREPAPPTRVRVVVGRESVWTWLVPLLILAAPFVGIGLVGVCACVGLLLGEVARGELASAVGSAFGLVLSLVGLAIGVTWGCSLLEQATRRTTFDFDGPMLRIEEQRFKFRRRVTTLERTRVVDVGLAAGQRDSTQVLLLLREGGAIRVRVSADAADTEALAASLMAGAGRGEARG
jgi:hypothetical protein